MKIQMTTVSARPVDDAAAKVFGVLAVVKILA